MIENKVVQAKVCFSSHDLFMSKSALRDDRKPMRGINRWSTLWGWWIICTKLPILIFKQFSPGLFDLWGQMDGGKIRKSGKFIVLKRDGWFHFQCFIKVDTISNQQERNIFKWFWNAVILFQMFEFSCPKWPKWTFENLLLFEDKGSQCYKMKLWVTLGWLWITLGRLWVVWETRKGLL